MRLFRHKIAFAALVICFWPLPTSAQCGFTVKPIEDVRWYRAAGWPTPGVADAEAIRKVTVKTDELPYAWPEGLTVSAILHRPKYQVNFPEVIFNDNGVQKKMQSSVFQLGLFFRWEMNGKIFAYSYELFPHDLLCSTMIDLIDDRGDGKFRIMASPGHAFFGAHATPPPIPEWLRKPQS